ncbi:hypothetical protein HID58_042362 [Brassica napus]|uniref:Uncharacterized protein n=1 Tax=Brassica napus TaxID=3708 RepID=A0ABQ8BDK3_BRANA|nr:hypothetical protein HID58_042362 [Brassica napus]
MKNPKAVSLKGDFEGDFRRFSLIHRSHRSHLRHSLSESVNGTNAGRKSLAEDKGPDVPADVPVAVPADASSSEDKAPEPSLY